MAPAIRTEVRFLIAAAFPFHETEKAQTVCAGSKITAAGQILGN
jgi:hypothetical protein